MSASFNPFDLLGDEGDTRKRKPAPQKAPAAPKPATPKAPAAAAPKPAAPAAKAAPQQQAPKAPTAKAAPAANNAAPAKKENGAAKPQAQRGDVQKGASEGERKPRPPRKDGERGPYSPKGDRPPRREGDSGRPFPPKDRAPREDQPQDATGEKPAFPRRNKGERRERGPQRGRQFDRQSGTGRPPTENKKGGYGKGNWGKDAEVVEGEAGQEKPENDKEEVAAAAEGEAEKEDAPPAQPEKELKGLDEYLAERKNKQVKIEPPKERKAGEGVDQSAWADYVPLVKQDLGDIAIKKKKEGKENKKEATPATTTPNSEVTLGFYLPPPARGDDDRRGRRGKQGGKPFKNERRGEKKNTAAADVNLDLSATSFPTLSGAPATTPAAATKPAEAAPPAVKAN